MPRNLAPMMRLDSQTALSDSTWVTLLMLGGIGLLGFLGNTEVALPMTAAFALLLPVAIFTDPGGAMARLCGTLPVSRRTVMLAHYCVALILVLSPLLCLLLATTLGNLVRGHDPVEFLVTLAILFGLVSMLANVNFYCQTRFGARAASFFMLAAFGLLAVGALIVRAALPPNLLEQLIVGLSGLLSPWVALLIVPLAWLTGFWACDRVYQRQDH